MELERRRSGLRDNFMRFLGVVLIAEAFALGSGTLNSLSSKHDRANGLTFTQIFAHRHGNDGEHISNYEFADGEALNVLAVAGLAGAGIQLIRRRHRAEQSA